ncbi:hypothetical protein LY625_00775 [Lysobacter sp. GX 14042]|uniref:hypothetical protein n=1 Tax=Lysobacter sp. GX 14042 TaxID=2907155 RepID=UPI001F2E06C2|nr:hypothetical protein [Lysobacter sp. GX 14042]MCE7031173.1 hypothetical protein [Lysobacter sp. GX 14042]
MSNCFDKPALPARQRGEMLVEALVGVLLTGLLGAGMLHVAEQLAGRQADLRAETLAMVEMRRLLRTQAEALCDAPAGHRVAIGGRQVPIRVECGAAPTVGIAAPGAGTLSVSAPREVVLSVAAAELGDAGGPALVVGTRQ